MTDQVVLELNSVAVGINNLLLPLKINLRYWDMGAYMHVHGYAIKVKLNVLHYLWGPNTNTQNKNSDMSEEYTIN